MVPATNVRIKKKSHEIFRISVEKSERKMDVCDLG
jgi:hypothetical protein